MPYDKVTKFTQPQPKCLGQGGFVFDHENPAYPLSRVGRGAAKVCRRHAQLTVKVPPEPGDLPDGWQPKKTLQALKQEVLAG